MYNSNVIGINEEKKSVNGEIFKCSGIFLFLEFCYFCDGVMLL